MNYLKHFKHPFIEDIKDISLELKDMGWKFSISNRNDLNAYHFTFTDPRYNDHMFVDFTAPEDEVRYARYLAKNNLGNIFLWKDIEDCILRIIDYLESQHIHLNSIIVGYGYDGDLLLNTHQVK